MRRQLLVHTAALGIFIFLSLLLTWPLVARFTTHVPGDGIDDPALAWNLWWIKERLVVQHTLDIFHVDWMFHPIGINLGFYTLTPLNGLLSIPLQTGLSLTVASNLVLLSSFVLGGYGTFLLVRYLGIRYWVLGMRGTCGFPVSNTQYLMPTFAAAVAGIVYAFASSKLFYASLGQFNIASSQWIPFAVLYTLRTGHSRRWQDAVLAGLFVTFQAWAELTYASFLVIFMLFYFIWVLVTGDQGSGAGGKGALQATRRDSLAHPHPQTLVVSFFLAGFVFLLGITPFLWAMVPDLLREGDFFASGGGFADTFSADLMGYLWPTRLHPWLGTHVAALPFSNDKGQQIFIGYSALIMASVGCVWLIRRWGWRGIFWPSMALWFWWLTLGDRVRWAGQAMAIPGPFSLISQLPFFSGNRYPSRYSVMLMLCVAVLVGYGWVWVSGVMDRTGGESSRSDPYRLQAPLSKARYLVPGIFTLIFLLEHLSVPLPLNDFRTPPIYQHIAAEPGRFTVLELPTGWRNGARVLGKQDVLIMMQQWYQTVHGQRRLGGNTSRNPPYKFQYFTNAPLIGDLILLMNADAKDVNGIAYLAPAIEAAWPDLVTRNRQIAPWVLDFLDVRFVTLHVDRSPPELVRFVEEALPVTLVDTWTGVDWTGHTASLRLYKVNARVDARVQPEQWTLVLGSVVGQLHVAEGWTAQGVDGRVRYATRREADLLLDLPVHGGSLTFQLYGPAALDALSLNGSPLIWTTSPQVNTHQVVDVQVPPGVADAAVDRLSLRFADLYPAVETLVGAGDRWPIGTTGVSLPVERPVFVVSAGKDGGDFAQIFVGGEDFASNELGYNLVALSQAGDLLASAVFNTHASPAAAAALADWLGSWPGGTIVAGAVRDEASHNLGDEAVAALRRLGIETDLRGHFRASHAFIGVVGAPPGAAIESFSPLGPASVTVGPPLDAPFIAGGIGSIEFRAVE